MKKQHLIWYLLFSVFVMSLAALTVYAHPGRTDANGGHTDHDTGEYHYHHGYPAHDHYDMDRDGVLDCPYDFEDKTAHSGGDGSGNSSGNTLGNATAEENVAIKNKEVKKVPGWVYWSLAIMAISIICLAISNKWKTEDIQRWESNYRRDIAKEKDLCTQQLRQMEKECQKKLQAQQLAYDTRTKQKEQSVREGLQNFTSDLSYYYSFNYLYMLSGAPDSEYIGKDDLPKSGNCDIHKWGEKYTFYTTLRPSTSQTKFHRVGCRYCSFGHPINAYVIQQHIKMFIPCSVCNPQLPNTKWVDIYLEHKHFLDEYMGSAKMRTYDERSSDI